MPRLFGTDGVRGVANAELTPDLALALGRAAGTVLGGPVVVGRDTRVSGPMLEGALVAGLCSAGVPVLAAGILPTPAVARLTLDLGARAGAVISASHNPVADNGIKFFSDRGVKLPVELEERIEEVMGDPPRRLPTGAAVGWAEPLPGAVTRYVDRLVEGLEGALAGLRVVLDCAFGAAFEAAPQAFGRAGAEVVALNAEPDGSRINVDCGSTSLAGLSRAVVAEGADLGLAFDGDADRVLAVDETGGEVDGDHILGALALALEQAGELPGRVVVATVMTNLGLIRALAERGIEVVTAPVGDRHVAEAMAVHGAALGGEQSGHIILAARTTTGDGILTGLRLAALVAGSGRRLSELTGFFRPYPQVLVNVPVAAKDGLDAAQDVWEEVRAVEAELGDQGRVLLRASGTEPLVRVMVEAADGGRARAAADRLVAAVERTLGRR